MYLCIELVTLKYVWPVSQSLAYTYIWYKHQNKYSGSSTEGTEGEQKAEQINVPTQGKESDNVYSE